MPGAREASTGRGICKAHLRGPRMVRWCLGKRFWFGRAQERTVQGAQPRGADTLQRAKRVCRAELARRHPAKTASSNRVPWTTTPIERRYTRSTNSESGKSTPRSYPLWFGFTGYWHPMRSCVSKWLHRRGRMSRRKRLPCQTRCSSRSSAGISTSRKRISGTSVASLGRGCFGTSSRLMSTYVPNARGR